MPSIFFLVIESIAEKRNFHASNEKSRFGSTTDLRRHRLQRVDQTKVPITMENLINGLPFFSWILLSALSQ